MTTQSPKTLQKIIDETLASVDLPKDKPTAAPMFVFGGSNNQINASLQGDIHIHQSNSRSGQRESGL